MAISVGKPFQKPDFRDGFWGILLFPLKIRARAVASLAGVFFSLKIRVYPYNIE